MHEDPDGPFFEDLAAGWRFTGSSGHTLDEGRAAWYAAMSGVQSPLFLDAALARAVAGERLVDPGLVAQVSIGQSTVATRQVVANLFYRGMVQHRPVPVGTTLLTDVEVGAASEARPRPDRPPRGKVVLQITTRDQDGEVVLSYQRCALVRKRDRADTGRRDDVGSAGGPVDLAAWVRLVPSGWRLDRFPPAEQAWPVGARRADPLREPVTDPLALVRLTGNLARAHRDPDAGVAGRPLVYGGHTVALAQASLGRMFPGIVTTLGWHACEHPEPVFEGDLLEFSAEPVEVTPLPNGSIVLFDVTGTVVSSDRAGRASPSCPEPVQGVPRTVLRWIPVALAAAGAAPG
jgi:2-methylfumaryl-CoA hydratase